MEGEAKAIFTRDFTGPTVEEYFSLGILARCKPGAATALSLAVAELRKQESWRTRVPASTGERKKDIVSSVRC